MMGIVLASASPRRKQLLEMLGLRDLVVMPAPNGEEAPPEGASPAETVEYIALGKARAVAALRPKEDTVIAADTLVYLNGEPLGKPKDPADAYRMLRLLSGNRHTVYTGLAVISGGKTVTRAEATDVFFRELSDREIARYVATGEPMDKAGAYGAQGRAAVFIRGIDGDFFNVMGLPLCALSEILDGFGVDLA
ncbi:MAG: septum formation protein Maf [Oscillospiraceae bacterium]|nr:septum formation protein Maf [Oscillospiraceae bacterium]